MGHSRQLVAYTAESVLSAYGVSAPQAVVAEVMEAVRNHDLESAKLWNEVGCAVDAHLAGTHLANNFMALTT